ncbi:efflux transporter outer membrane subunit [Pseudemcibacter aquimaris]|uniref:efflux transporter outer membrane subunit n=1 Tax=Pseudemcibacter aquimaris TaxID=2857064 RepID=UPI002011D7F7|nr:TolC family protein [Pseudemcibacter aquimaris]MCC3861587.1 TolC family protein [Pseudemcibacter aquimaris]WDU58356.1 TolC family protein [Pseudemcibacter aquimaris]
MNTSNLWTMSAMSLMLASCASLPDLDSEMSGQIDISKEWQTANSGSFSVEDGWLDQMNNPDLSQFVAEVLEKNPNYNEVALRMQAAGYNADAAFGRMLPRIGASGNVTKSKNQFSNFNQQINQGQQPGTVQQPISNTNTNYNIGLDASWEVDVWGRLSANTAVARSNYEVAEYDYYGARLSLASQVAQGWFDVIEAKQQWDLAISTVENYERATKIIRNRFERGLSSGLDLRLSVTNLEASKATEQQRMTLYYTALRQLELFAGKYPAAAMDVAGQIPDIMDDVPVGVPLEIIERRPDLRSARARLYAAAYRAEASEKAMLPTISITARGNNTTEEFGELLKFDNVFWNLIGGITQPIFQGGQLRYAAKAEQLNFEAQKQNYATTLLRAFKEVEDALDNDRSLAARVAFTESAALNAIAAERVALEQYSQGLIPIATLLQSQRQSLTQQSQLLSIKKQRINNRISLYLALGGDFTTSTAPLIEENANIIQNNEQSVQISAEVQEYQS